jgi:CRISPR/Cas system-associated endonuclease Cas1
MRWPLLDRLLASAIHEPSEGARFSLADRPRQRPCYSKTSLRPAAPIIIGVIHSGSENKAPLVYDLMEPLRSVVDRKILEFALSPTFTPGDFANNNLDGCRLNPQMAKGIANMIRSTKADNIVRALIREL